MDIDHVGLRIEVVVPDAFQQHGSGYHLTGVTHQELQQLKLARLQVDPLAGANLTNRVISWHWINLKVAKRFIAEQDVEYVVDRAPFCCAELEQIGGRLVFDGIVEPNNHWRVWAMPSAAR